jgi:hypothetical protein
MDTRLALQGITFIWGEAKARKNPRHHDGMTFEQAAEAFCDPFLKVVDAFSVDVLDALKRVAPLQGFSGCQPLIRAYVGQGLRADLQRLE